MTRIRPHPARDRDDNQIAQVVGDGFVAPSLTAWPNPSSLRR
jgi:hypothetical protein